MRDPHVKALHYRLTTDEQTSYAEDCPSVYFETETFSAQLEDDDLTVTMKAHCATEEGARELVQPHLRAWEIHVALQRGPGELEFEFDKSEIIDRDPRPGELRLLTAKLEGVATASADATLSVTRARYPEPPEAFSFSPMVEILWTHFHLFKTGRWPLTSMAYFCFTVLEEEAEGGGKPGVSKTFGISQNVLEEFGRLSARERKHAPDAPPLTANEKNWLLETMKMMIRKAGEYAHDRELPLRHRVTLADLPTLNS